MRDVGKERERETHNTREVCVEAKQKCTCDLAQFTRMQRCKTLVSCVPHVRAVFYESCAGYSKCAGEVTTVPPASDWTVRVT